MSNLVYNVDFLIASLVFLFVILYHFLRQKTLNLQNNRSFLWLMIFGIANIVFDLLCTFLITWPSPERAVITESCLTVLYFLQFLVPLALLRHILFRLPPDAGCKTMRLLLCVLIPVAMTVLLAANHWTHLFFTVCADGSYVRGPWYIGMFVVGGLYLAATALCTVVHRKIMSDGTVRAVWELATFSGVTVLIQSFYHDALVTGFGIALGITVLFLTLNNPYQYTDSVTSTFDIRYFRDRCDNFLTHHKKFHIVLVELTQIKRINRILGTTVGNRLLNATAQMLRSCDKQNLVFRISGKKFLVMTHSLVQYEVLGEKAIDFFSQSLNIDGELVSSPAIICGVMDAQNLKDSDTLLAYTEYLTSLVKDTTETCTIQGDQETLKGFNYNQEIESFLYTAIDQNLFDVVYQPVYSLEEKKYVSLEVLSRLHHPKLGFVPPDVFITIAEKMT